MKEKLKVGEIPKPRFEFRSFGQNFSQADAMMKKLTAPVPDEVKERQSEEIYIVSSTNNVNNAKIRNGRIDIKTYIQTVDGLEQWNPLMKGEFPLSRVVLENDVFPAFMVDMAPLKKEGYTLEEFMSMIEAHQDLQVVDVHKHRFGYMVNDTICEMAIVIIDGTKVVSINSESTETDDVKKTLIDTGLDGVENINYLQAIKRVIGMVDKPLAN